MQRLSLTFLAGLLALLPLAGCGAPGAPQPPSLELPKPVTDLRAQRKGDKVFLSWTVPSETTDRHAVRHLGPTRICRSLDAAMKECGTPVGQSAPPQLPPLPAKGEKKTAQPPPKIQGSYTDEVSGDALNNFPRALNYAVVVPNDDGKGAGISNRVQVPTAPTLPPPGDFRATVTADGVMLDWTGISNGQDTPELHYMYRIYRRTEAGTAAGAAGKKTDAVIAEVPISASNPTQFVDHSFEWAKTYYYRATVLTVVSGKDTSSTASPGIQIEGDDTAEVKVFADDIFSPAVPSGLQAVYSGPGQKPFIDLIWAPDTEVDLAGYNIYRREESGQAVKINSSLATAPAFRDSDVVTGKKYFYTVSAVDVRGNESAQSAEVGEAAASF